MCKWFRWIHKKVLFFNNYSVHISIPIFFLMFGISRKHWVGIILLDLILTLFKQQNIEVLGQNMIKKIRYAEGIYRLHNRWKKSRIFTPCFCSFNKKFYLHEDDLTIASSNLFWLTWLLLVSISVLWRSSCLLFTSNTEHDWLLSLNLYLKYCESF